MTVLNFNAGPAAMPVSVLQRIGDELTDVAGSGISILETSHRSAVFADIAARAEASLRALLAIPDEYAVLFMQGGATAQFGLTVQNLDVNGVVAYADTGHWSKKAIAAGRTLTDAMTVAELQQSEGRHYIPPSERWDVPATASYVHICDNETIGGVAYPVAPAFTPKPIHALSSTSTCTSSSSSSSDGAATPASTDDRVPLVADFSSSILSGPLDVSRYDVIYAGAQKNIGPAGLTLVILSPEMLARSESRSAGMPAVFNYSAVAAAASMLNTPPTFAWYAAGLVFDWLHEQGGLAAVGERNVRRANALYAVIDEHSCFHNDVHSDNRSCMNVPFTLPDEAGTMRFLDAATQAGMIGLRGHKAVGGIRASIYNAVPDVHVTTLIDFMIEFARTGSA